MSNGAINYEITLDDRFSRPLAALHTHVNGLQKSLVALGASFVALQRGFAFVSAQVARFQSAISDGAALEAPSRQTGETVGNLVILQTAFRNADLAAEAVRPALAQLARALGGINEDGQPTSQIIAKLGLNLESLRSQSPLAQLDAIGKRLREIQNPADRAAAAMQLFGRSGTALLAVLGDSQALSEAQASSASLAALYQRNAALFDRLSNAIRQAGESTRGVFVALAGQAAPLLEGLVSRWKAVADAFVADAGKWKPAITSIVGHLRAFTGMIETVASAFQKLSGLAMLVVKGFIALGLAWAGIKFAALLQGLTATVAGWIGLTAQTVANTAATEANTAAQLRNAAARAAGLKSGVAAAAPWFTTAAAQPTGAPPIPGGLVRTDRLATGGAFARYALPQGAQLAESATGATRALGGLQAGLRAGTGALGGFSAAGLAASLNIGLLAAAVIAVGVQQYIAKIEAATAALEAFGAQTTDQLFKIDRESRAIESAAQKKELLARVNEKIAEAEAALANPNAPVGVREQARAALRAAEFFRLKILAVSDDDLAAKEKQAAAAKAWADAETAATYVMSAATTCARSANAATFVRFRAGRRNR
jgi:hypothetical protein